MYTERRSQHGREYGIVYLEQGEEGPVIVSIRSNDRPDDDPKIQFATITENGHSVVLQPNSTHTITARRDIHEEKLPDGSTNVVAKLVVETIVT